MRHAQKGAEAQTAEIASVRLPTSVEPPAQQPHSAVAAEAYSRRVATTRRALKFKSRHFHPLYSRSIFPR